MKKLLITTLVMGFISLNAASAAQEINHADGKLKMGRLLESLVWSGQRESNPHHQLGRLR